MFGLPLALNLAVKTKKAQYGEANICFRHYSISTKRLNSTNLCFPNVNGSKACLVLVLLLSYQI